MFIVVYGVSGAGKTTVGQLLAERLGVEFLDADDFHSEANKAKMAAGIPLDDEDRKGWLENLADGLRYRSSRGIGAVLACSALKKSYREKLTVGPNQKFIYLKGSFDEVAGRLEKRQGHFMNPALLRTQFETLEEPDSDEWTVDIGGPPDDIVERIIKLLR